MVRRSIKTNAILSTIKTLLSMVFPLITFPYISRVLQVEAIGKYNFAASVVSYFVLLADLGIATYAIREGTRLREDRIQISRFASEMVTIHILSAVASIVLLCVATVLVLKLRSYWILILILSIQIPMSVFGRSWIYSVYEEFGVITLTQVVFQFFTVVLLFLFVHTPQDLYVYTAVYVISTAGANLLYGFYSKKYIDIRPVGLSGLKRHMKPILLIFATTATTTIYVNSDTTILGWLVNDEAVGIYSTAVKVYNIVKHIISAVIIVLIPRLTQYAGTERFKSFFNRVLQTLALLILPSMVGLFMLSENVIDILAGVQYMAAVTPLRLLCVALGFSMFACLYASGVLIPNMQERAFLVATIISAAVNIVLNFILIPYYSYTAAAFTTLVAEMVVLAICFAQAKKYAPLEGVKRTLLCILLGCIAIVAVCMGIKRLDVGLYLETILCVGSSVLAYCGVQVLLKNAVFTQTMNSAIKMLKRKG